MGKHATLANRLKELRRALAWTQQDLSRASGLTRSYISRLEMGDIALPSSEKLRALAQALGTAPDDLLQAAGYIDNPSEASDLPDVKVYLRRKYAMQDPRTLQAIETIINGLQPASTGSSTATAITRRTRSQNDRGGSERNGTEAPRSLSRTNGETEAAGQAGRRGRKARGA